mgnify:CR=1 FL=1
MRDLPHRDAGLGQRLGHVGFRHHTQLYQHLAQVAAQLLLRLQGVSGSVAPKAVAMRADFDWPKPDRRNEFLRVRINDKGGLDLFTNQSSWVLTSTVWGDGLVDNPPGQAIAAGDTVHFLSFSDLLY